MPKPNSDCKTSTGTALLKREWDLIQSTAKNQFEQPQKGLCLKPANFNPDQASSLDLLFSKGLPHDLKTMQVNQKQMRRLMRGIQNGDMSTLNHVKLAGTLKLHSPSNVMTVELTGPVKTAFAAPPPPKVTSEEAGAEMVELYWMCLLRDLPYTQWNNSDNKLVRRAVRDLEACGEAYRGARPISSQTLFRAPDSRGSLIGPHVSVFAYLNVPFGASVLQQKCKFPTPGIDYMTKVAAYKHCQNGQVTEVTSASSQPVARYITTIRDGGEAVHADTPYQWGQNACQILLGLGAPLGPLNPFANGGVPNETNFIDLGLEDFADLMSRAMRLALGVTWYNKWNQLRLRPENVGYLVQTEMQRGKKRATKSSSLLSKTLLQSKVLSRIYAKTGSWLLPQSFAEGCPPHPSYPAGHATFASAATTIAKAFFDGSFLVDAVVPNADGSALVPYTVTSPNHKTKQQSLKLRIDDELDKLASNVALWRNGAGVHYLSDAEASFQIGEGVAISVLQDCVKRYSFAAGFQFRKRNGEFATITNFAHYPLNKTVTPRNDADKSEEWSADSTIMQVTRV